MWRTFVAVNRKFSDGRASARQPAALLLIGTAYFWSTPATAADSASTGDPTVQAERGGEPSATWGGQMDYLVSQEGNRPIDIVAASVYRMWSLPFRFAGGLGLGALNAAGHRLEIDQAPASSNATGFLAGGTLRWSPVELGKVKPFVEGSVQFLYTFAHPFPAGGTSVNGFVRWGGGVSVPVSSKLSIEAGYHGAHISNGGGLKPYNPAWNGRGAFIGFTWRSNSN